MLARHQSPQTQIELVRRWTADHLPNLNIAAYEGEVSYQQMARRANDEALLTLPPINTLTPDQTMQLLIPLGFLGSSVERHAQQQFLRRAGLEKVGHYGERIAHVPTGHGLAALRVWGDRPFIEYFQALADAIGHPHRDTVMSMAVFNGPAVYVRHPVSGARLLTVPSAFDDGAILSFTDSATEHNFYDVLKRTHALQAAANTFLTRIQRPENPIDSRGSVDDALNAATLIWAMRAEIIHFMNHAEFNVDHFLDHIRQYECTWYAENPIRPPSVANDPTSLLRDIILFDNMLPPSRHFKGFRQHVEGIFSVLLPEQASSIRSAMKLPTLETRLFEAIGMKRRKFDSLDDLSLTALLAQYPWLGAYMQVYNAQRDLSRAHYGLVEKFIIRPKRERDLAADARERVTVVDNARGTTGMDPLRMVRYLDDARQAHPLARLSAGPTGARSIVKNFLTLHGYHRLSYAALRNLTSLDKTRISPRPTAPEWSPRRTTTLVA